MVQIKDAATLLENIIALKTDIALKTNIANAYILSCDCYFYVLEK